MLKIDISPRQSGKTQRALEWLAFNGDGILLVHNRDEVNRLRAFVTLNKKEELAARILSYDQYDKLQMYRNSVYVDNAEIFIMRHFGHLAGFSLSNDDPSTLVTTTKKYE